MRHPIVDHARVTALVVKPWARYGHDRLYVQTADGTRIGYWDNKTGQAVAEDDKHRETVESATAGHRSAVADPPLVPSQPLAPQEQPAVLQAPIGDFEPRISDAVSTSVHTPETFPGTVSWIDLSLNRPGQAAREQAVVLKQAAPVKTFFARALGVRTDERAWRIGADGEEAVAVRLAKLGPAWKVLHAIPVGNRGSDIDHVVIGPGGVFTVNAKHHPRASVWVGGNTFLVNGQRQPYIRNSRHEAQRASRLLTAACGFPVAAVGLIAVMGAHEGFTVKEQPPGGDVHVITRREIDRWLRRRAADGLTPGQVEAVHDVARRSTTWQV